MGTTQTKEVAVEIAEACNGEVHKHGEAAFIIRTDGILRGTAIDKAHSEGFHIANINHYNDYTEIRFNNY